MRQDGRYEKTFTYEGRRYHVMGQTEREAIMKMANRIRDLEERKIEYTKRMTVEQWALKAVRTYKTGQKEITREKYMQRMRHCIFEEIGSYQIGKIKPIQVQNVLNLQAGKSKTQINEVYQMLKFIFKTAVDNGLIPVSPAEAIVRPKGYKTIRREITASERAALYKAIEACPKLSFYRFMLECGCRTSEVRELKGMDIKLVKGVPMLHIRGTKTEQSDRTVPMPRSLYDEFKDSDPFDFIFTTERGRRYDQTSMKRLHKRLYREMNIAMGAELYRNAFIGPLPLAPDFEPYCFRHTYCSDLIRAGANLKVVQKLMGHATMNMTMNIYSHVNEDDILSAAEFLPTPLPTLKGTK